MGLSLSFSHFVELPVVPQTNSTIQKKERVTSHLPSNHSFNKTPPSILVQLLKRNVTKDWQRELETKVIETREKFSSMAEGMQHITVK